MHTIGMTSAKVAQHYCVLRQVIARYSVTAAVRLALPSNCKDGNGCCNSTSDCYEQQVIQ
jgi:hypothetical protein